MNQTRKVVINNCYGGFGLSPVGVARLAALQGRECYFYVHQTKPIIDVKRYVPATAEEARVAFMFYAFDVPNAHETFLVRGNDDWHTLSDEQRAARNDEYGSHKIDAHDMPRDSADLIRVVEELGAAANGSCAALKIVEIPADAEWQVEEYDGNEWIAEQHRRWS